MKARFLVIGVASAIAFAAASALADHNSTNGEGWANMPNDIHNTRIETRESGDDEAFRDFVKYGEGADSVNRFASDDTTAEREKAQKGEAKTEKAQTRQTDGTRTSTQVKEQKRSRIDTPDSAMSRQRSSRSSAGPRRSGGRGKR